LEDLGNSAEGYSNKGPGVQKGIKEEIKVMDEKEKELEKKLSLSELEDEELDHELSKTAKKARIKELKRQYGSDWKKVLGWVKSLRVDKETARNLYGDFSGLREYSDPRRR